MRIPRLYLPKSLNAGEQVVLPKDAHNHLTQVLRLKPPHQLTVYNGEGGEYNAELCYVGKNKIGVEIKKFIDKTVESPLKIHLGQCISRGKKMDFTIQKSVELGITDITPIFSKRSQIKLDDKRAQKRLEHWQAIATCATEQCGRNELPVIHPPIKLSDWITARNTNETKLILQPSSSLRIRDLEFSDNYPVTLLIGPEGGFNDQEFDMAIDSKFQGLSLGPRILRTETAALATLSALQARFGDV